MDPIEEETEFSAEVDLGKKKLPWSDKYQPQKPKYSNRVQAGYEWVSQYFFHLL
jgi:hypothetical protein